VTSKLHCIKKISNGERFFRDEKEGSIVKTKILHQWALVLCALWIAFGVFVTSASAQLTWVPLDASTAGTSPTVECLSTTTNTTVLRVTVHGFWDETTPVLSLIMHKINLPNCSNSNPDFKVGTYGYTNEVGKSALPVVRTYIAIRSDITTATVSNITFSSPSDYIYTDNGVFPYLKPVTHDYSEQFVMDSAHYASTSWYPYDPYSPPYPQMNYGVGKWHVLPIAQIPINNFFVIPATSHLRVYRVATITINTTGTGVSLVGCSPVWQDIFRCEILNLFPHIPWQDQPSAFTYPVLRIYVADSYAANAALGNFITWKKQQGYSVSKKQVPTDVSNTYDAISTDIKSFYNTYSTRDVFVLLVGDTADVKSGSFVSSDNTTGDTDYKYTLVSGDDDYGDLFIGRISVDDSTDVTNIFNKIIKYEKNPPTGTWVENVDLVAYRAPTYTNHKEAIRTNTYSKKTPTFTTRYGGNDSNATNANVKSDISTAHRGIVNYDGHGSDQVWSQWEWPYPPQSFTITDIGNLTNGDYTPIVVSTGCHNSNIGFSDCIAEEWLEAASKGAVAHLGGSLDVWTDASGDYDKYFFEDIFDDGVYQIGCANVKAHTQTMKNRGDKESKDDAKMFVVLGDPSMRVRTTAALDFDSPVNGPNPVTTDLQLYTVTVKDNDSPVQDAIVAIEKGTEGQPGFFRFVGKTNASGQASFWINPSTAGNVWATVSKHNYITWEGNPVPPPTSVSDWELY
jgi:hypothetical protein